MGSEDRPQRHGNSLEPEGLDQLEPAVQVLLGQAHTAADLIWTRANILILLNGAALALVGKLLSTPGNWNWVSLGILLVVSIAGVGLGIVWWRIHKMSEFYNTEWMHDARQVCLREPTGVLRDRYYFSLGFYGKEQKSGAWSAGGQQILERLREARFTVEPRPTEKSATEHFRWVIVGDIALWSLSLAYSIVLFVLAGYGVVEMGTGA